jgi:phosphatidylglycerophosphate synthase
MKISEGFFAVSFSNMPSSGTLVHSLGHNWLGKADIAVQTVFLAVGLVAVGLRLWARRLQWNSLQMNDWSIVLATVRLKLFALVYLSYPEKLIWRYCFPRSISTRLTGNINP